VRALLVAAALLAAAEAGAAGAVTARDEAGAPLTASLVGGRLDAAGALRGARVALTWPDGARWDGFDAGLHPWLLAGGRFARGNVLLVGVRKAAIFDRVERPRPFLYTIRADRGGLRKRWLGTSLSRPLVTACFADLDRAGEDELVAVERTATGELALGAYRWEGFGVEGVARSGPLPAGDGTPELAAGPGEVVVAIPRGGQRVFRAYALRSEALEPWGEAAVTVGKGAFTWEALPGAVRLTRGSVSREVALVDVGGER
jgi:hypothetical protein